MRQLELKDLELTRFETLYIDRIRTLEEKLVFEREILKKYESLSKIGATAEIQQLQQRNTLQEVEGRLREIQNDGLRQKAIISQERQRLKSEISRLKSELTETRVTLKYQRLRAPVDGVVFDLQPKGGDLQAEVAKH